MYLDLYHIDESYNRFGSPLHYTKINQDHREENINYDWVGKVIPTHIPNIKEKSYFIKFK